MKPDRFKLLIALEDKKLEAEIKELLSKYYDVHAAGDAEEVYHTIHHFKPDLAIMDYNLKNINPIELYEGVEFLHPGTTYVLCATEDNMRVAKRIWHRRAVDYIRKPFSQEQLLDDIYKLTRHILDKRRIANLEEKVENLENEIKKMRGKKK